MAICFATLSTALLSKVGVWISPPKVTRPFFLTREQTPLATSEKAYPPQLAGTVVEKANAMLAGASVQVRSERTIEAVPRYKAKA